MNEVFTNKNGIIVAQIEARVSYRVSLMPFGETSLPQNNPTAMSK